MDIGKVQANPGPLLELSHHLVLHGIVSFERRVWVVLLIGVAHRLMVNLINCDLGMQFQRHHDRLRPNDSLYLIETRKPLALDDEWNLEVAIDLTLQLERNHILEVAHLISFLQVKGQLMLFEVESSVVLLQLPLKAYKLIQRVSDRVVPLFVVHVYLIDYLA